MTSDTPLQFLQIWTEKKKDTPLYEVLPTIHWSAAQRGGYTRVKQHVTITTVYSQLSDSVHIIHTDVKLYGKKDY